MSQLLSRSKGKRLTRKEWSDLFVNRIKLTGCLKKRNDQSVKMLQRWNKRWFFLTDEVLAYAKNKNDTTMRGIVAVQDIVDVLASDKAEKGPQFEVKVPKRSFFLRCKTRHLLNDWISAIQAARLSQTRTAPHAIQQNLTDKQRASLQETVEKKGGHVGKGVTKLYVDSPCGETPKSDEEQPPKAKPKGILKESGKSRPPKQPEKEQMDWNGWDDDDESDGYESNGSWNDSDMDMSPIPTPTDPKLWHPRFAEGDDDDDDPQSTKGKGASGADDDDGDDWFEKIDYDKLAAEAERKKKHRADTSTPATPFDNLALDSAKGKSGIGRGGRSEFRVPPPAEQISPPDHGDGRLGTGTKRAMRRPSRGSTAAAFLGSSSKQTEKELYKSKKPKLESSSTLPARPRDIRTNKAEHTTKVYGNALFDEDQPHTVTGVELATRSSPVQSLRSKHRPGTT